MVSNVGAEANLYISTETADYSIPLIEKARIAAPPMTVNNGIPRAATTKTRMIKIPKDIILHLF